MTGELVLNRRTRYPCEVENMELARSDESPRTIKARLELGHFDISLKKREVRPLLEPTLEL